MGGPRAEGAFPALALPGLDGVERPLAEAWSGENALLLIGHKTCKTTRQTLPYVDRIWRRRAPGRGVLAILQDGPEDALELRDKLGLTLPILLEADPYPLARAVSLVTVPTLFLVDREGLIRGVSEGFVRAELEAFAQRIGVPAPLFTPEDKAPAMTPG